MIIRVTMLEKWRCGKASQSRNDLTASQFLAAVNTGRFYAHMMCFPMAGGICGVWNSLEEGDV
jgi:hypothetical protein